MINRRLSLFLFTAVVNTFRFEKPIERSFPQKLVGTNILSFHPSTLEASLGLTLVSSTAIIEKQKLRQQR